MADIISEVRAQQPSALHQIFKFPGRIGTTTEGLHKATKVALSILEIPLYFITSAPLSLLSTRLTVFKKLGSGLNIFNRGNEIFNKRILSNPKAHTAKKVSRVFLTAVHTADFLICLNWLSNGTIASLNAITNYAWRQIPVFAVAKMTALAISAIAGIFSDIEDLRIADLGVRKATAGVEKWTKRAKDELAQEHLRAIYDQKIADAKGDDKKTRWARSIQVIEGNGEEGLDICAHEIARSEWKLEKAKSAQAHAWVSIAGHIAKIAVVAMFGLGLVFASQVAIAFAVTASTVTLLSNSLGLAKVIVRSIHEEMFTSGKFAMPKLKVIKEAHSV